MRQTTNIMKSLSVTRSPPAGPWMITRPHTGDFTSVKIVRKRKQPEFQPRAATRTIARSNGTSDFIVPGEVPLPTERDRFPLTSRKGLAGRWTMEINMFGWLCRTFGHRWRYGNWELFARDRPLDVWKRDVKCSRCRAERWQVSRSGFKPPAVY